MALGRIPVSEKTGNYATVCSDNGRELRFNSGSAVTCSLPVAATVEDGYNLVVRNVGAGTLTIDPNGTETIDGATSLTLPQDQCTWIRTDGTSWCSIGNLGGGTGPTQPQTQPQAHRTVQSTDTGTLATCAAGGTQVGGALSVDVPTQGLLRLTWVQGKAVHVSGSDGMMLSIGLKVGSSSPVFQQVTYAAVAAYEPFAWGNSSYPIEIKGGKQGPGSNVHTMCVDFDVDTEGFSTGSQTVEVRVGSSCRSDHTDTAKLDAESQDGAPSVFVLEVIPTA